MHTLSAELMLLPVSDIFLMIEVLLATLRIRIASESFLSPPCCGSLCARFLSSTMMRLSTDYLTLQLMVQ